MFCGDVFVGDVFVKTFLWRYFRARPLFREETFPRKTHPRETFSKRNILKGSRHNFRRHGILTHRIEGTSHMRSSTTQAPPGNPHEEALSVSSPPLVEPRQPLMMSVVSETFEIPSNIYKPKEPLMATVLEKRTLTLPESPNQVCHVVFDIAGTDFWYLDGQSVGILPPGEQPDGKPHKLRLYSIASPQGGDSGLGDTLTICTKRLVYTNEQGETIHGVCSNYVCDLNVGDKVALTGPVGKAFLYPTHENPNLILIATGTGIAPFRAFLRTRYQRHPQMSGDTHLFFGMQYGADFLYREELESYRQHEGFYLHPAISREQQTAEGKRLYVQHRIAEQLEALWPLLEQPETVVYLCGLKGMETGVVDAFAQYATVHGYDWPLLFAKLQREKRWHLEVY
jgi:ferredoxin--NADP+ reductase